jgi:hypothetical protein
MSMVFATIAPFEIQSRSSSLQGDRRQVQLADPFHSAIRVGNGRHHGNVFEFFELHLEACGVLLRVSNRLRLSRPPGKQAVVTAVERPYACNRRLESNPCRGRLTSWANQSAFICHYDSSQSLLTSGVLHQSLQLRQPVLCFQRIHDLHRVFAMLFRRRRGRGINDHLVGDPRRLRTRIKRQNR